MEKAFVCDEVEQAFGGFLRSVDQINEDLAAEHFLDRNLVGQTVEIDARPGILPDNQHRKDAYLVLISADQRGWSRLVALQLVLVQILFHHELVQI